MSDRTPGEDSPFRLGYRPSLDGLRGVAVLFVMVHHLAFWWFPGGFLGVTYFFALSGFLITTILCSEYLRFGDISMRRFYRRRVLRLYPALIAVVVLYLLIAATLQGSQRTSLFVEIGAAATYTYDRNASTRPEVGLMGHMWSLAVEEQFYLLWPFVLLLLVRSRISNRSALFIVAAAAIIVAAFRGFLTSIGGYTMWAGSGFVTRADALLVGCLLGLALSFGVVKTMPGPIPSRYLGGAALLGLLVFAFVELPISQVHYWVYPLVSLLVCVLILDLVQPGASHARQVLSWRPLCLVGVISYGLYLWHFPVYYIFHRAFYPDVSNSDLPAMLKLAMFATSFVVAIVSWHLIEQPFLRRKGRRRGEPLQPTPEAGAVARPATAQLAPGWPDGAAVATAPLEEKA